jgi:hypothetical protein
VIDPSDSTACVNLVAIDVAKDWNVVLVLDVLATADRSKLPTGEQIMTASSHF